MESVRCKRCNRILTSKESIERGYGEKCFRIVQLQKKQNTISNTDIQFLKCEINMLKRQLKEIKASGILFNNIESIERIKQDEHRPERNEFKVQFNVVVKELKIIFNNENFDYHQVLKPIDPRTEIEKPPILENLELIH